MSPEYIAALRASAGPAQGFQGEPLAKFVNGKMVLASPKQAAPQPQKGKGGFLSSIISEAGGAGGAALGGAIGTALIPIPGLGTLIGAGIGGALGGTGGRLAENKIRDNKYNLGSALKEGALSGVLGAGGEAFQLAKAGKAITGSKSLLRPIENITAGAAEKAAGRNIVGGVENIGKGIKASGLGLAQGANAPGISRIGAAESDKLVNTVIKDFKIKPGSPEAVQRALEKGLAKKTEELTALYANNNVKLAKKEMTDLAGKISQRVSSEGGLDAAATKYANEQITRLAKNNDVSGLWKFTKDVEKHLNFARAQGAAEPAKESVGQIIRNEIRTVLDSKVPGIKEANTLYHNGSTANALLTKATTNSTGGGITGKVFSLAPVKSAEAKIGSAVEGAGRLMAGTGGPISAVTNQAIRQSPASLGRAIGGAGQMQPDQSQFDPNIMQTNPDGSFQPADGATADTFNINDPTAQMPQGQDMQQSQPTYTLADALNDSRRDPKNASQYLAYAKAFEAQNKAVKPSVKAQDAAAAGSQALNIVDNLQQAFSQAGGGQGRIGGTISTLSGKAGLNNSVQVYNDAKMGFLSNVARSLGEKGVLTDADIERVGKLFPSPTSTPQEAAAKWSMIKTIINGGVQKVQSAYGGGNQLADILGQMNGGQ